MVICQNSELENGHRNFVDFPMKHADSLIFYRYVSHYQRVNVQDGALSVIGWFVNAKHPWLIVTWAEFYGLWMPIIHSAIILSPLSHRIQPLF